MFRKITQSATGPSSFATRIVGVAAVAALAVSGVAFAQASAPVDASGAHARGWHHEHHHGGLEHELMKLQPQLKLSAPQQTLWATAVATTKANREQARTLHQSEKTQMQSEMQVPILDLSAMHSQREQQMQQFHQLREQTDQAWLAVYNSLNDQQKTLVSQTIKADLAQMQARQAEFKQHWQQRHGAAASAPAAQ
jgi:hypothetical protein